MGALVHDLRAVPAWPPGIYVDTSVLLAAFRAGVRSAPRPKEIACGSFVRSALSQGCALWTTLLAIEEACWYPFQSEIARTARKLGARPPDLKHARPADYARALAAARPHASNLMHFLKHLGVVVRSARTSAHDDVGACAAVCYAVRKVAFAYDLEMADCFHVAFSVLDGTSAIATLDSGYQSVDGLEVYTVP
jgi:predicted nucleic acid-binding protein